MIDFSCQILIVTPFLTFFRLFVVPCFLIDRYFFVALISRGPMYPAQILFLLLMSGLPGLFSLDVF